jgi:hypothetical protein
MPLSYYMHWHNIRYEINKRVERFLLTVAMRMPGKLRMWVVVDATNTARRMYPHTSGYAGPDGLCFQEIYDGALREKTCTEQ